MDLHGHHLYHDDETTIRETLKELRAYEVERGFEFMLSLARECRRCGREIHFVLRDGDPIVESQAPSVDEFHDGMRELSLDTPCPETMADVVVPFTCRSGRIALANDLRRHFADRPDFERDFSINSAAGKRAWIEHMASFGYLTGFVGNTSVDFVRRPGGLDVIHMVDPDDGGYEPPLKASVRRKIQADKAASVHHIYTELWWFAIVDAADLPDRATDSFGRPIGFVDLPPGEYEMAYHLRLDEEGQGYREVWAEIRRK